MEDSGKLKRALIDASSGAISGGISRIVTSPLDVIKIRFQVQLEPTSSRALLQKDLTRPSKYTGVFQATKDIFQEEGLRGFWRGNVPALLMVMPYTAIQFTVLHKLKTLAAGSSKREDLKHLSPYLSYVSGALAGCAATVGSYPFDLIRTILASQGEPKGSHRENVCSALKLLEEIRTRALYLWICRVQLYNKGISQISLIKTFVIHLTRWGCGNSNQASEGYLEKKIPHLLSRSQSIFHPPFLPTDLSHLH